MVIKNPRAIRFRAEELANGLNKFPIGGISKLVKVSPKDLSNELRGKKVLYFSRIIGKETLTVKKKVLEIGRVIILTIRNGSRLTVPFTWWRIHARFGSFGLHTLSRWHFWLWGFHGNLVLEDYMNTKKWLSALAVAIVMLAIGTNSYSHLIVKSHDDGNILIAIIILVE